MSTRFPRIRRVVQGIGLVQLATGATTQREHTARVALFNELADDSQVGVIKALLRGDVTLGELRDAKRRKELQGGAILASVALNRPLFGKDGVVAAMLPQMGKAASTRARYRTSLTALERQTFVEWPHTPMRVCDLPNVRWGELSEAWLAAGKSAADWNHVRRALSSLMTVLLDSKYAQPRLDLMKVVPLFPEDERVPDLTPDTFRRILDHEPVEALKATYITLLLTGMRARSEYLRCRPEHLMPETHGIRLPARVGTKQTKTRKGRVIAVDASCWPWIVAAIPCVYQYKALHEHWTATCIRAGVGSRASGRYVGLRLHDLRHALGQWAEDAGVALTDIQQQLGHATLAMTARYARRGATRRVAGAVGTALVTSMSPTPKNGDLNA